MKKARAQLPCSLRQWRRPISIVETAYDKPRTPSSRIVDAGCLRRGAVELDDLKISPFFEVIIVLVTNVVLKTEAIEGRDALGIARLTIVRVPKAFTKVLSPAVRKKG